MARFEFPYMAGRGEHGRAARRRTASRCCAQTWQSAIAALGGAERLVIGGKSMGGRMASLVADEADVRGLVCLGYPFHPPGQPEKLRTAHLDDLRTPDPDRPGHPRLPRHPRGRRGLRACRRGSASSGWRTATTPSSPAASSGHTEKEHLAAAVAAVAGFVRGLV